MGKLVRVRAKGARHLTFVESDSEADVEYEIARKPDGAFACACMAFVFNKDVPKRCKHIDAYVMGGSQTVNETVTRVQMRPTPAAAKRGAKLPATLDVETFTFRRAISFGSMTEGGAR